MCHPISRVVLAAFGLLTGLVGCIPVAYVYPKFDYLSVRGLPEHDQCPETRPKITAYLLRTTTHGGLSPLSSTEVTLSTIPISHTGDVKHLRVTLESGAVLVSALSHGWTTSHDSQLRLYRRGFETIEIDEKDTKLHWIPVQNAYEFEQAIDQILSVRPLAIKQVVKAESMTDQMPIVQVNFLGKSGTLARIALEYARLRELIIQGQIAVTRESYRDEQLKDVNRAIAELSSEQDLTDRDQLRLDLFRNDLEFEQTWSDPLRRLQAKINWLQSKSRSID